MDMKAEIAAKAQQIEAVIASYLPKEEGYQKTVIEAMNYSVLAGGKRLRPMLMWETYRMFGGRSKVIEPFMAAIEMIHTYGEAMGILAGDGLLNYAFETAVKAFEIEPGNANIGKALQVLARKAGIYGMLGGQCVDVEAEGKPVAEERLEFIYRLKTGALLESAMLIGAILAGATKGEQRQVAQAAGELGLAFQIQDDILDVTSTTEILGKPVGSDEKNCKATWVTLRGMDSLVVRNEFLANLMLELMRREK